MDAMRKAALLASLYNKNGEEGQLLEPLDAPPEVAPGFRKTVKKWKADKEVDSWTTKAADDKEVKAK